MKIKPYEPRHQEAVVQLSLRAWAPVFDSIRATLDPELYQFFYPDWREAQQKAVEDVCATEDMRVYVAEDDARDGASAVAGFVAMRRHADGTTGEIYMIAVDPETQKRGVGAKLTEFALDWMKSEGLTVAMVETGADPGHAPARRLYEKAGFRIWPAARYFKKL